MNRIRAAILFSGGDAPGMNPLLRAFVRLGRHRHRSIVLGIRDGFQGLTDLCRQPHQGRMSLSLGLGETQPSGRLRGQRALVPLDDRSVSGLAVRGGTVLGAGRCQAFRDSDTRRRIVELLDKMQLSALLVCGGEGSLAGAAQLANENHLQVLGIPCTIDNDIRASEISLGFDTAVNNIVSCVRLFSDTAESHHRVMVLEVMGRHSGQLAEHAALASGAEIVVIPEQGPLTRQKILGIGQRIEKSWMSDRRHAIVIVGEGVRLAEPAGNVGVGGNGPGYLLADRLQQFFRRPNAPFPEVETRASVLGHLQRGGRPVAGDVLLAARFAEAAWNAITDKKSVSGILAVRRGRIHLVAFGCRPRRARRRAVHSVYQLQKDVSQFVREGAQNGVTQGRPPSAVE